MSAPNPVNPSDTGGDVRAYEPSMEEILASIRRIIADDQSIPGRSRGDEETMPPDEPEGSVHVLRVDSPADAVATTPHMAEDPPEPAESRTTNQDKISAPQYPTPEGPVAAMAPSPQASAPSPDELRPVETTTPRNEEQDDGGYYFDPPHEYDRPETVPPAEAASLFSASTNKSVSSAFNVLAASRLADNSEELLGMAREMIRPLLRTWLDENLPSMVERLVREEIERVARGGGR